MRRHHPQNERIRREYFAYLEQARHMTSNSVDQVAAAIAAFELSTNYKDFRKFHILRLWPSKKGCVGKLTRRQTNRWPRPRFTRG